MSKEFVLPTTTKEPMQRMLPESVTIPAIKALIGSKDNYKAVRTLIGRSRKKQRVTDVATQLLLEEWSAQSGKWRLLKNLDPLVFAIDLLSRETARPLADNVVLACAEAGFYGRFPEITQRILGRDPNKIEIMLLVTAYVNDKASRSEDTEKKLMGMAAQFLKLTESASEIRRIYAFQKEWEETIDC